MNINGRWYWAPPAPAVQVAAGPSIAFGWYPGRVAWIGSDEQVGWVPLAPAEVYYSHHYWGPSSVVVTAGPAVTVSIGKLAFASAAIIVPQASFYSVNNYSSVRITNINQTTIVNNFHAAPIVNNSVLKDYSQDTAKYNFTNKAPSEKPHSAVTERIVHNEKVAGADAKNITPQSLKQAAANTKPAKPAGGVAVPPPTKLTNMMVPPNQVNAPKGQAAFKQVDIMKNTRPATASSAAKAGGPGASQTPGVKLQPPAPGATQPGTPGVTQPQAPGATHPGMPGVTQPHQFPSPRYNFGRQGDIDGRRTVEESQTAKSLEGHPQTDISVAAFAPRLASMEKRQMTVKIEDKLFLNRFNVDEESHLRLLDPKVCFDDCKDQPCLFICPANVTSWKTTASA